MGGSANSPAEEGSARKPSSLLQSSKSLNTGVSLLFKKTPPPCLLKHRTQFRPQPWQLRESLKGALSSSGSTEKPAYLLFPLLGVKESFIPGESGRNAATLTSKQGGEGAGLEIKSTEGQERVGMPTTCTEVQDRNLLRSQLTQQAIVPILRHAKSRLALLQLYLLGAAPVWGRAEGLWLAMD